MEEVRELARRLELLERAHRRTKPLCALLIVGVCAIVLMGQASVPTQPNDGKVRAEGFIVTDSKGKERASLVTDESGSVFLILFDKESKPRADLQVSNFGPSLNFYDPDGKTRLVMGSTSMVGSHVSNNGIMEKNPPSSIVMFDSLGQFLWRTP